MLRVDRISNTRVIRVPVPHRGLHFLKKPLAASAMHGHAAGRDFIHDLAKTLSYGVRGTRSRLFDIYCPGLVEAFRKIDLHTRELRRLALRNKPEPVPPRHKATVPVDVGSLIGNEIASALVVIILGRGKAAVVRENERLHLNGYIVHPDRLLRQHLGCRIFPAKGVESGNRVTVNRNRQLLVTLYLAAQKSVKDECQVFLNQVELLIYDLVALLSGLVLEQPVKISPDNQRAGCS